MSSKIARHSRLACALYSCVFGFSDRYLYRRLLLCCRSCLSMFIFTSGPLGIRGVTASRFLSTVSKTRKASGLTEWTAATISYKVEERCRLIIRTRRGVCLRAAKPMNQTHGDGFRRPVQAYEGKSDVVYVQLRSPADDRKILRLKSGTKKVPKDWKSGKPSWRSRGL